METRTLKTSPARQSGVAILAMTIILLLVATLGTLAVGKTGLQEQRTVAVDVRSKEVYSAATGGLEYAVKWFEWEKESTDADGNLVYTPNYEILTFNENCPDGSGSANCALLASTSAGDVPDDIDGGADVYGQTIWYELLSEEPIVVRAFSMAEAAGDSHVEKTVAVDLFVGEQGGGPFAGNSSTFDGPPILVEDCTSGVTGTPDIVVMDDGDPSTPIPAGLVTVRGDLDGSCMETGHANQYQCPGPSYSDCPTIGGGRVRTSGGSAANNVGTILAEVVPEPPGLFQAIFSYDTSQYTEREFIEYLAQLDPDHVAVMDSDMEREAFVAAQGGVGNVGSDAEPVIMYFGSSYCPKLNGGYRIWGLVYYADTTCDQNGWGNSQIFGTMAKAGNITKLTANTQFINDGALKFDFGATIENDRINPGFSDLVVSVIPGTWRDF